ncbi:crotonase/enoyl-CoA hydratase family protein [Halodurantibacterium flavum]|uniref:Crotonase/enoyl-CoA hydratase family protein n=1 Tax=Halodurantibacterium flavum TaxID=1382802 RepID=A0ABW4S7Q8_9RHOB
MAETVSLNVDGRGVATLRLCRGAQHNALSAQMMDDLAAMAHRLGRDPAVRVVVLAAEGESFCAGADLGWMQAQTTADSAGRLREAQRLSGMLQALDTLPKPLVGCVQGSAYGGGLGLLSVCDVAVATENARFAFTETRLGLIPATIGPYVVARMGAAMARRVFMSARRFTAAEAVALGLVARAVQSEGLGAAVEAEVAPYLACAPGAVADAKALLRRLAGPIDAPLIAESMEALIARWESPEAAEGLAAFFGRRPAPWATDGRSDG